MHMKIPHPAEARPEAQALMASELRYRRVGQAGEDGILILGADTGVGGGGHPSLS